MKENLSNISPVSISEKKTGIELKQYIEEHFPVAQMHSTTADKIVYENIMNNEVLKNKLPVGMMPEPRAYLIEKDTICIGLDLATGYFLVEGSTVIYDDLIAFRGLDETDLENYFSVVEYVTCTGMLQEASCLSSKQR